MRRTILLLALVLLVLAPAPLAARDISIRNFHSDVRVLADGTTEIIERIDYHFEGTWNGIERFIPIRYRTPAGFNYNLQLDVHSVSDGAGQPLQYEKRRDGGDLVLKIWVPGAQDATRTVVIHYRVPNGLRFFDAGDDSEGARDELYWNVTGNESEMPIEKASARVVLPPGSAGVRAQAFTGAFGSTEQAAEVGVEGDVVTIRSTRPLGMREGLTVAVAWEPGVVERPDATERTLLFLRANGLNAVVALLPLGALLLMGRLWSSRGRDPREESIVPLYEPPDAMTPAELGTLVDHDADMCDITATLVDLAVRGYIVIEETSESKLLGLKTETDYVFHLGRPESEWGELHPHERRLLSSLFSGAVAPAPRRSSVAETLLRTAAGSFPSSPAVGTPTQPSVTLSSLQNSFYQHLGGIRDAIYGRLIARGYYRRRPDHVKAQYIAIGVAVGAAVVMGGLWLRQWVGLSQAVIIPAGVLTALIIIGFGWFMPARTVRGARVREGVLGFKEFLDRVESDRFRRMITSPEMFERFLPHAMALGVEERWAAAFEDLYRDPPHWYRGGQARTFHARGFTRDLGRMSSRATGAMTSQPRSSGGSGFGGGGSSGGGFGGGGSRGF